MRFEKWQALGNDYIVIERDELQRTGRDAQPLELTPARIRRICDAHFGVGGDGVLLIETPRSADSVARLAIFNPDGSRAELSGNGAREAILYLRRSGWTDAAEFTIETDAGQIVPRITGPDTCTVDMGHASLRSKDFPTGPADGCDEVDVGAQRLRFRHVSIGNPQCAIAVGGVEQLRALDLQAVGPPIESDARFPNRTNVSWYAPLAPDANAPRGGPHEPDANAAQSAPRTPDASATPGAAASRIRARIFERGVGETLSSGTGASGAAIAHVLDGGASPVLVELDGGELTVDVGEDLHVNLTGWAKPVFAGQLSEELIEELHETE